MLCVLLEKLTTARELFHSIPRKGMLYALLENFRLTEAARELFYSIVRKGL